MQVFEAASRHMLWLSQRQAVTAENIANADTPGYRGRDIAPFDNVLHLTGLALAQTGPGHMSSAAEAAGSVEIRAQRPWDRSLSGNDVSLEQELMKASETGRMMALDTSLVRSFHRMFLSSVKV